MDAGLLRGKLGGKMIARSGLWSYISNLGSWSSVCGLLFIIMVCGWAMYSGRT